MGLEPLESRTLLNADPVSSIQPDLSQAGDDSGALVVQEISPAVVTSAALLPDLTPWISQSHGFLYDWTVQGNELRLTTAAANVGTGRLELRGGASHGNTQDVYQRIYEPNGSYTDVLAGTFQFHAEHGHIHFEDFAEFRLRAVLPGGGVGAIVAAGDKVSFCLLDVERYDNSGPGSPYFLSCGQVQGISAGWADVYDRGLPGQSIDITGVPDGTYWLEQMIDPSNHLIESNENNNAGRIQIVLERGPGGGTILPDTFEPNDTFSTASILAPPEDHTYPDLSIHVANNSDYYRVTASASGTMTFSVAFQHSLGDIDMQVFNASQSQIGQSDSVSNSEQVSVQAVAGQYYFVRVFGYQGATNPNYSMTVDQPQGSGGQIGDLFEENDSFAAAHSLPAADQTYMSLSIDAANDDDYYSLVPAASGTMTVSLAFQHSQGDIDLQVFNASQSQIGLSDSVSNSEQVSVQVTAGQTYYVRAFGFNGAVNPSYSMTIDVPEPVGGTAEEYYLSTTAGGTLSSTDGAPSVSFDDSDILRLTVQTNGQYHHEIYFDGSDVGLTTNGEDIDAFVFLSDGSILISTQGSFSVPAGGGGTLTGNREDLLHFVPTSMGANTSGQWSLYFDGSDVGLSTTGENIDSVAVLSDGRLLISTTGGVSVNGASGQDEDLLAFTPTALGPTTAGSWSLYFDGSDVGLSTNNGEDVNALDVRETAGNPTLFFSTIGAFSVPGVSGADEDAFAFNPSSLGTNTAGTFSPVLAFDGSSYGLASFGIDGIHLGSPPSPAAPLVQGGAVSSSDTIAFALARSSASVGNEQSNLNGEFAGQVPSGALSVAPASEASRADLHDSALAALLAETNSEQTAEHYTATGDSSAAEGQSDIADLLSRLLGRGGDRS